MHIWGTNTGGLPSADLQIYAQNTFVINQILTPNSSALVNYKTSILSVYLQGTANGVNASATLSLNVTSLNSNACDQQVDVFLKGNVTCKKWTVQLANVLNPGFNGFTNALVNVYFNGQLTNQSVVSPHNTLPFSAGGQVLYFTINQTVNGGWPPVEWSQFSLYPVNSTTTTSTSTVTTTISNINACNQLVNVYVGNNVTCKQFTVKLDDLSYPNSNGISAGIFSIYYNNVLTNQTVLYPGQTGIFHQSNVYLNLYVNKTFPGLYAYQKWAQIMLNVAQTSAINTTTTVTTTTVTTTVPQSCTTPWEIVYLGANITCGSWSGVLQNLGNPNSTGSSNAIYGVYYSGVFLTSLNIAPKHNASVIYAGSVATFYVNTTFNGLYKYQKWAQTKLVVVPVNGITTTTSTTTTFTTTMPHYNNTIAMTASDPQDSYPRYWEIFIGRFPGYYKGNGVYQNASSYSVAEWSGAHISYNYAFPTAIGNTIYFLVTQSGGNSYGTYSGNVSINGAKLAYNGIDAYHAIKLVLNGTYSVSLVSIPSGPTTNSVTYTLQVTNCTSSTSSNYFANSVVQIMTPQTCNGLPFIQWIGSGNGSYSGANAMAYVTMLSNITESAFYEGTTTSTSTISSTISTTVSPIVPPPINASTSVATTTVGTVANKPGTSANNGGLGGFVSRVVNFFKGLFGFK